MNSSRNIARLAGIFWILVGVTTGFSLGYVRSKLIVFADAATTATNIVASEFLFRASIVSSILTQIFLLFLGLTLFRLFKRSHRTLATVILAAVLIAAAVGVAAGSPFSSWSNALIEFCRRSRWPSNGGVKASSQCGVLR